MIDEEKLAEFNEKYGHKPGHYVSKEVLEEHIKWFGSGANNENTEELGQNFMEELKLDNELAEFRRIKEDGIWTPCDIKCRSIELRIHKNGHCEFRLIDSFCETNPTVMLAKLQVMQCDINDLMKKLEKEIIQTIGEEND